MLCMQRKQELMRRLLAPIVTKFDELLRYMIAEPDLERQAAYAKCINQAMGFARYVKAVECFCFCLLVVCINSDIQIE